MEPFSLVVLSAVSPGRHRPARGAYGRTGPDSLERFFRARMPCSLRGGVAVELCVHGELCGMGAARRPQRRRRALTSIHSLFEEQGALL